MIKAIVINLGSARERMEFQREQLERLGIPYERMPAVDIESLTEDSFLADAFHWQRPLRAVEVACFHSHMRVWQRVCELGAPTLVLEDDALLCCKIAEILKSLEGMDFDYVSLETRARKKVVKTRRSEVFAPYALAPMIQDRCGAAGYLISPDGAQIALAQYRKKGAALADAFLAHLYHWNAYQLVPAAVVQIDCASYYGVAQGAVTQSSISGRAKPRPKGIWSLCKFKGRRLLSQLLMAWRIGTSGSSERLDVGIVQEHFKG